VGLDRKVRLGAYRYGASMRGNSLRHWLTQLGVKVASPVAFLMVPLYGVAWIIFYRESFSWASIATLATWFMTLLIQRAAHRDTQAIHAKLDELLRAQSQARDELVNIDQKDPEEIEKHRKMERAAG
jgi:low affinity Fe/Cu permease